MDTMSGAILDELIGMTKPEKKRLPYPRRYMAEKVIGSLIVMALYVGTILAFLTNF